MATDQEGKCLGEIGFDAFATAMGVQDFGTWGDLTGKIRDAWTNSAAAIAHAGVLSLEKYPPAGLRKMAPSVLARWLPILAYAFQEVEKGAPVREYAIVVKCLRSASAWAAVIAAGTVSSGVPEPLPLPKKTKMHGTLIFPFGAMTEKQRGLVFEAQRCLQEAGISFGSSSSVGMESDEEREWYLDWELQGARLVGLPATDNA